MRNLIILVLSLLITTSAYAISFDGVDDKLTCGTGLDDIFSGGGSVSVWVNVDAFTATTERILSKRNTANGGGWSLYTSNGGGGFENIVFDAEFSGGVGSAEWENAFSSGGWVNLVLNYNSSSAANEPTLYVNGVAATRTNDLSASGTYVAGSSNNFVIGGFDNLDRTVEGSIIDVGVYSATLGQIFIDRINSYTTKFVPIGISTALAYYPLHECAEGSSCDGISFRDETGNGNDCTGDNGTNNTGLTGQAQRVLSYP